jgi:hypothetical protein
MISMSNRPLSMPKNLVHAVKIGSVETPNNIEYGNFREAIMHFLGEYDLLSTDAASNKFTLNVELIDHSRTHAEQYGVIYESTISYTLLEANSNKLFFKETLTSQYNSDERLINPEIMKQTANRVRNTNLAGKIVATFFFGPGIHAGTNVTDEEIQVAINAARGNSIRDNIRSFMRKLSSN